jgi:hypothetical protein
MKHYKDSEDRIFGFLDGEPIPGNLTEISMDEVQAIVAARVTDADRRLARIAELKRLLRDSDYVALPDYDKDKADVIAQRQAWRDEIRSLEA